MRFFFEGLFDFSLEFANRKIQFIRARSMMSWFRRICQFSQLVPTDISTNGIYKPHNNFSKSKLRKKKQHRRNGKLTIQQKKKKKQFQERSLTFNKIVFVTQQFNACVGKYGNKVVGFEFQESFEEVFGAYPFDYRSLL